MKYRQTTNTGVIFLNLDRKIQMHYDRIRSTLYSKITGLEDRPLQVSFWTFEWIYQYYIKPWQKTTLMLCQVVYLDSGKARLTSGARLILFILN